MPRKKNEDEQKLFDVARPGKSAPSASGKPIIITNRPLLQDPMVVADEATGGEAPSGQAAQPSEPKVTIKPITINVADGNESAKVPNVGVAASKKPEAKPVPEAVAPAEPIKEEVTGEVKDEPATKDESVAPAESETKEEAAEPATEEAGEAEQPTEEKGEEADKSVSEEDAEKDEEPTVPEQAQGDPDAAAKEAARLAAEHTAEIEKLAEGHEYYLPIETTESRKTKHFIALGAFLILLLGVAWVDIALDAGLVQLGSIKPVTHFFRQTSVATPVSSTPRVVASQSYSAPVAKLSFRYPTDWQLISAGSTADHDTVTLSPTTPSTSSLGDVNVAFLSIPVTSPPSSIKVKAVHYQKLSHKIHGDVYLRDLIYEDAAGKINLVSSLGDKSDTRLGQTLQVPEQSFTGADGTSQNYFGISVVRVASGLTSFASVSQAETYLHSAQYQQARTILLSTNVAK